MSNLYYDANQDDEESYCFNHGILPSLIEINQMLQQQWRNKCKRRARELYITTIRNGRPPRSIKQISISVPTIPLDSFVFDMTLFDQENFEF